MPKNNNKKNKKMLKKVQKDKLKKIRKENNKKEIGEKIEMGLNLISSIKIITNFNVLLYCLLFFWFSAFRQ